MEEIFIPLIVFSSLPLTIWVILHHRVKARGKNAEVVRTLVENGKDVDRPMIRTIGFTPSRRHSDLRTGLILVAISLAVIVFGAQVPEEDARAVATGIASFPFLIGVAILIFWYLVSRKEED